MSSIKMRQIFETSYGVENNLVYGIMGIEGGDHIERS